MSARGFKSVGWVAAVGASALGCYMLSLQVATERNDLASVQRQIVAAKQDIRSLQTELGTRGRLSQLERWNADVLALSAPVSGQYLKDEFTLARFDRAEQRFEERAEVRMASADTEAPAPAKPKPAVEAPVALAAAPAPDASAAPGQAIVHRAALAPPQPKAVPRAPVTALVDDRLARQLGAAAQAEKGGRSGGTR